MSEHITHEPHDETAWNCLCGNTPTGEGFTTCDRAGLDVEPDKDSDWDNLYRCNRCRRIIDQRDLRVVGTAPQCYRLTWRGIDIEARYWPLKWGVTAHLEIESIRPERAPLPVTGTGYRSHFHPPGTVEAQGGDVAAQVIAWLDEEAESSEWRVYADARRQGELF